MPKSINNFIKGLNTDVDILSIPSSQYTYALNAIIESVDGDMTSIGNELGTVDLTEIKQIKNAKILGHTIIEKDVVLFVTGNCSISNQKISEIGVIEHDNQGGKYRCYIRTGGGNNIINNNQVNQLIDHSSKQLPIQTEIDYLNFNSNYQIDSTSKVLSNKHRVSYFTDDFNVPRKIDLDSLILLNKSGNVYQSESDLSKEQFNTQLNLFLTTLKAPEIRNFNITNSGNLLSGSYQFLIKYKNANENTTDFLVASVNIPINNDPEGSPSIDYDGCPPSTQTKKSINILIDNLDQSYPSIELYVVYKKGLQSTFKAGLVSTIYFNNDIIEFAFSSLEQITKTIDSRLILLEPRFSVIKAKCIEQKDNRLLLTNLEDNVTNDLLFQRIANSIVLEYEIETINYHDDFDLDLSPAYDIGAYGNKFHKKNIIIKDSGLYKNTDQFTKNPNWNASKVTYKRGEVYDFAFTPVVKGKLGKAYHIPAKDYGLNQLDINAYSSFLTEDSFLKRYKHDPLPSQQLGCFYSNTEYPKNYGYPTYTGLSKSPQRFHVIPDNTKEPILDHVRSDGSPLNGIDTVTSDGYPTKTDNYLDSQNNLVRHISLKSTITNTNPPDDSNILQTGLSLFEQLIQDGLIDGYYITRQQRNSYQNRIILAQGLSINTKLCRYRMFKANFLTSVGNTDTSPLQYMATSDNSSYSDIHLPPFSNNFSSSNASFDQGELYLAGDELANASMFYAPDFIHKITDQFGYGNKLKYIGEHCIGLAKAKDSGKHNGKDNNANKNSFPNSWGGLGEDLAERKFCYTNDGSEFFRYQDCNTLFPYYRGYDGGPLIHMSHFNFGIDNLNKKYGYYTKVANYTSQLIIKLDGTASNDTDGEPENNWYRSSCLFLNMANFKNLKTDYIFNSGEDVAKLSKDGAGVLGTKKYGKDYISITNSKLFDKTLVNQNYQDSSVIQQEANGVLPVIKLNCSSGIFYSHIQGQFINNNTKVTKFNNSGIDYVRWNNANNQDIKFDNFLYVTGKAHGDETDGWGNGVTIPVNYSTPVYEAINENIDVYGSVLNGEYVICNYIKNNNRPNYPNDDIYQLITTPVQNKIYGGDTYTCKYGLNVNTLLSNDGEKGYYEGGNAGSEDKPNDNIGRWRDYSMLHYAWYECSGNLNLRHREEGGWRYFPKNKVITKLIDNGNVVKDEDYGILTQPKDVKGHSIGYNKQYDDANNLITTFNGSNNTSQSTKDLSNRTIYSEESFDSETKDSFQEFKILNYKDIPRNKGEAWDTFVWGNEFYIHTAYSTWKMFMNPTAIQTTSIGEAVLGTGKLFSLPPQELISLNGGYGGSNSQWSCINTPEGHIFLDINQKKIFILSNNIEDISNDISKELFNYMVNKENINYQLEEKYKQSVTIFDNPINFKGAVANYDYKNNRYIITFHQSQTESKTYSYSLFTKAWVSEHSYKPTTYISNGNRLLMARDYEAIEENITLLNHPNADKEIKIFEFQGKGGSYSNLIKDDNYVSNTYFGIRKIKYGRYLYEKKPNQFIIEFIVNTGQGIRPTSGKPYSVSSLDSKVFDSMIIKSTEKDFNNLYTEENNLAKLYQSFDRIICSNSYQYNDKLLISDNTDFAFETIDNNEHLVKYKDFEFKLSFLRDNTEDEARFKDKFVKIKLIYNNDHYIDEDIEKGNKKITLSTVQVDFRENSR